MATHSSVLAWRIPGAGEPDGLPSMGSHRVGHDWSDLAVFVDPLYLCLGAKSSRSHVNKVKPEWLPLRRKHCWSPVISLKYITLKIFQRRFLTVHEKGTSHLVTRPFWSPFCVQHWYILQILIGYASKELSAQSSCQKSSWDKWYLEGPCSSRFCKFSPHIRSNL